MNNSAAANRVPVELEANILSWHTTIETYERGEESILLHPAPPDFATCGVRPDRGFPKDQLVRDGGSDAWRTCLCEGLIGRITVTVHNECREKNLTTREQANASRLLAMIINREEGDDANV
nr:PREDICTED: uncharacterized protein LOC105668537 isoform X1 [Linepithema humile]